MSQALCPDCGGRTHRSRARTLSERLIRAFTRYRVYRCTECSWRGWHAKSRPALKAVSRRNLMRTIIAFIITIVITILLALSLTGRI